jgi:hypothetical protein
LGGGGGRRARRETAPASRGVVVRSRRRRCLWSERRGEGRANRWDFPHCASPCRFRLQPCTLNTAGRRIAGGTKACPGQLAAVWESSSAFFHRKAGTKRLQTSCAVCGRKQTTAVALSSAAPAVATVALLCSLAPSLGAAVAVRPIDLVQKIRRLGGLYLFGKL